MLLLGALLTEGRVEVEGDNTGGSSRAQGQVASQFGAWYVLPPPLSSLGTSVPLKVSALYGQCNMFNNQALKPIAKLFASSLPLAFGFEC